MRRLLLTLLLMTVMVGSGQAISSLHIISQRHRAFNPTALEIEHGSTVEIVNDDGELVHHAYVQSDRFSFDSGEQEPGSKLDVVFPVAGTFTVLCRIHPRMHLDVTVH